MTQTKEQLLNYLQTHHISYKLYEHAPLMTVTQGLAIIENLNIPGTIIKNLFLKDDHQNLYLISATFATNIDLKALRKTLNLKNLRFADATLLTQYLGVQPGSVTPLALINDTNQKVKMILDANVLQQEHIQIHPLQNNATIVIKPSDLINFFNLIHRTYRIYDFTKNQESTITS